MLARLLVLIASLSLLIGVGSQNPIIRQTASKYTGMVTVKIPLSGTGSMYPTFPKGQGKTPQELSEEVVAVVNMYAYPSGFTMSGSRYLFQPIGRGDIVEFQNIVTDAIERKEFNKTSGFVKRVIGLPNDTIEIRDGQVLINGEILTEAYTALPRSTFGGQFLPDCTKLSIPEGKYFVMGDNRKGSGDSRHEVGFVDDKDIHYILPKNNQSGVWDLHFRDTSNDNKPASKIKMNVSRYVELVNERRLAAKLKPLKFNQKLEQSTLLRGRAMLKANDLSFEATKSGYTIKKAVAEAGYWNPILAESFVQGYYEAEELIESTFEQSKSKDFLLNPQFQDIGLSQVEGELNGCPTQIVIQHLAGYVPPDYEKEQVQSWRAGLNKLKEIQPGWRDLANKDDYSLFYSEHKSDVDRINEIIDIRLKNIEKIVIKMESNQWLSTEEENYMTRDEALSNEQRQLSEKLNENN